LLKNIIANTGSCFLAQFTGFIVRYKFSKCITRYQGDYKVKDFSR